MFLDTSDFPILGGGSSYASQAQHSGMFTTQTQGPLSAGIQPPGPPPGISAPGTAGVQGQSNGLRDDSSRTGEEFPALGNMSGNGAVPAEGKDRVSPNPCCMWALLTGRYQISFVITVNTLKHRHHLPQHYPTVHPAHIPRSLRRVTYNSTWHSPWPQAEI